MQYDKIIVVQGFQVAVGCLECFFCISAADWDCTAVSYWICTAGIYCKTIFRNWSCCYGSVGLGCCDGGC